MLKKSIITTILFLLITGFACQPARADIPVSERSALSDLYTGTNGTGWDDSTGWNGSPGTECDWFGVTCDSQGTHVTRIDLDHNSLEGNIPDSFGNLTELILINLSYNSLTGTIPVSVANLAKLQALDLGLNSLTGNIPPELGNISRLTYIFLHYNSLTGEIPPELGNLKYLRLLKLGNNELSGTIPPELGNLANLQFLTLYKNRLEGGIPPELGNLGRLRELCLQGNMLSGEIPPELGNLAGLTPGKSDLRWNGLYTEDDTLDIFLSTVQESGDWKSTQTLAPAGLTAGTPGPTSVPLSWTGTGFADEYEVVYADVPGGPYTVFGTTVGTETEVTGLSPGKTWYFRVRSVTHPHDQNLSTLFSSYSEEVSAVPEVSILTVSAPDEQTVYKDFIEVAGIIWDMQYTVTAVSDRHPGLVFPAVTQDTGAFSCEVPLLEGRNLLTFTARNPAGDEARKSITVTFVQQSLLTVSITSPADGATVYEETVTVSGTVTSDSDPGDIILRLGNQTAVPQGENGAYTFSFENVRLVRGANILEVVAETGSVSSSARVTVSCYPDEDLALEIHSPLPGMFFTEKSVTVRGTARSGPDIVSVTVNSAEASGKVPESGRMVSFEHTVYFAEATDLLGITVTAKDRAGRIATVTLTAKHDSTAPVITLVSPPDSTPDSGTVVVTEIPYPVEGTVTEKNPAGISVNSTGIGFMPAGSDMWSFRTDVFLAPGEERQVTVEAWDSAGKRAVREFVLKLDSSALIEMISPRDRSRYVASGTETEIIVTARVSGAPEGATAEVSGDGGPFQQITLKNGAVNGKFVSPPGDHVLTLRILNAESTVIARTSVHYTVTDADSIPLRVENLDPGNNAKNAEPDSVIRFFFNQPAGKISDFEVTVKETAHGFVYENGTQKETAALGADSVSPGEVHRDMETVPGKFTFIHEGRAAEFYPDRNYAYSSRVLVEMKYKDSDLSRSQFRVRDVPTLVMGTVTDRLGAVVAGMEVSLPGPGRTAVTDSSGRFGFGFGEPAEKMLPPGLYRLVINPNLKNRAFGTLTFRTNVEKSRLNRAGVFRIPLLSPEEPFRRIGGDQSLAVLAGGRLRLDLSDAVLTFPDGRREGDVHVMPERIGEIPSEPVPGAIPYWMFAIQPSGTEVSGPAETDMAMSALYGTYEYIPENGTPVVIAGSDAGTGMIVPVGAGRVTGCDVNRENCRVKGRANFSRLDYIGYAFVQPEQEPFLEQYLNGEISLRVLTGRLMQEKPE